MRPTSEADLTAERWVLETTEGEQLLADVARAPEPGPSQLAAWRRRTTAERVAAAVRLAGCRRRGAEKFERAGSLWLTPVGLEQATPEMVARHKARRFEGAGVVDLCAGLGGDAAALAATAGRVIAVDLDPAMPPRIAWNARAYGVGDRVLPVRARAERFATPAGFRVHVDPDRRAGPSPRARRVEDYSPGLGCLLDLAVTARGGAFKLSPASDFASALPADRFEFELVSLRGECKEVTAWFGDRTTCRRRATALPSGATWTDGDGPSEGRATIAGPLAFVFDPDPALVRAGLLDGFALAHGLARLAPGVDLLSSDTLVDSPWLAGFAVEEQQPVDRKRLRRLVAERGLGPLEIKVRGLDLTPEALRRELKPPGPRPATLICYGGPGIVAATALLARRI